jgi:hypothetical protein
MRAVPFWNGVFAPADWPNGWPMKSRGFFFAREHVIVDLLLTKAAIMRGVN